MTIIWGFITLVQGLTPVAAVYLTRLLIDGLTEVIKAGGDWESLNSFIIPAALMVGIQLLTEATQRAGEWIRSFQAELVQDYLSRLIHDKAVAVDLAFYETTEYHDRLYRATNDVTTRPLALLENIGSLVQSSITLVGMGTILISYGIWLPFVLLLCMIPALYVVLRSNQRYHRWWHQTTQERRWLQYFNTMLTHYSTAAEMRMFELGAHFQFRYKQVRSRLRLERLQLVKDHSIARLMTAIFAFVISGLAFAWLIWQCVLGLFTLGDLALFYQAFNRGQDLLRTLLNNVGQIQDNSLFLGNLFEFLDLEPGVVDPQKSLTIRLPLKDTIRFRDITFLYPGSERAALQNFDLSIPVGKVVAIIGPNGAGKSTLVKLLCRFYDPQSGSIELDGVDIRNLAVADLRHLITVLFQYPVPYHATAEQNIAFGDISSNINSEDIQSAAQNAGAHQIISRLPLGYDTLLGKLFANGFELSAGEWQRIALARAYLRKAPIIILDEPTSFMDSWAESEWFERFLSLSNGHTALLITHRFTIARRADIIHVMNDGRIIESGSHIDLLEKRGVYAKCWFAQTEVNAPLSNLNGQYLPHIK
jgi:ATP-binding cassette subfamily B protein